MIPNILKNIQKSRGSYPKKFTLIINNLQSEDKNDESIKLLWKAYSLSKELHKNQKRASGEPYFTHCESVGVILSEWKIDIDTIRNILAV